MSVGATLFNLTTCLETELVVKFQKPEVSNAAADISDTRAEIEPNDDGTAKLRLYLTFGYAEIPLDGRCFNVSAKEAMLQVACEGVEIDPSSKFGRLVRPNSSKTTITQEAIRKSQTEIGVALAAEASPTAQSGSASASAKGKKETQHSSISVTNTELESLRVEAIGNDRWRIREHVDPGLLRGDYLGDEALCTIRAVERANRQRIEVTVEIRQRNLVFDPNPGGLLGALTRSTNRDKLSKILMAKSLHRAMTSDRPFEGVLVASLATCGDDEK